jgi:hypothetical protein
MVIRSHVILNHSHHPMRLKQKSREAALAISPRLAVWTQTLYNRPDFPDSIVAFQVFLHQFALLFTSLAVRHGKNYHHSGAHPLRFWLFQLKTSCRCFDLQSEREDAGMLFLRILHAPVFNIMGGPVCWVVLSKSTVSRAGR